MVSDGGQKGQPSLAHGQQDMARETVPHPIELGRAQAAFLAGDHVTGTEQQRRIKGHQMPHALSDAGGITGGAVAAVQIADQADPQGFRGSGGLVAQHGRDPCQAQAGRGEAQQLSAITTHPHRTHRGAAWGIPC